MAPMFGSKRVAGMAPTAIILVLMGVPNACFAFAAPRTPTAATPPRASRPIKYATTSSQQPNQANAHAPRASSNDDGESSTTTTTNANTEETGADASSLSSPQKFIVAFGGSAPLVPHPDRDMLGGKGLGLQEMSNVGIDVPPGFTLTTPLCQQYEAAARAAATTTGAGGGGDLDEAVWHDVHRAIRRLELDMDRQFGRADDGDHNPLLVSVRSGAAVSMPGMMDTVLNVGLNKETVVGLARASGNKRFAYDSYRRLLDMFGGVVLGIPHEAFEAKLAALKRKTNIVNDMDLSAEHLEQLCESYYTVYADHGKVFPQDANDQLRACIKAVFGSWNSERAIKYREINGITSLVGTACNIQTMVYGNLGTTSGTGVAFSRDPGTGKKELKGEYLVNAQGEDVVAGIRTPENIDTMAKALPEAYSQFLRNVETLERHFKDMQDIEFTVENGKLWMLQCRSGKRTGHAAIKIAVDLVEDGLCTQQEALFKVEPDHIKQVLHPTFSQEVLESAEYAENVVAVGLAGGPGAAVGKLVFSTKKAEEMTAEGVILVREVTSPEDVGGMWASQGILTCRGGVTSHAAVVARGWGKPCICGCDDLEIDEDAATMTIKSTGEVFKEGDIVSLNGSTGEVIRIPINTESASQDGDFGTLLGWADAVTDTCKVMANADSATDASKALELGAKGIGLCRTEHMFFAPDRLPIVRQWILRDEGLTKIQEFQRKDFKEIMQAMDGKPVTIRLLDPPLHEFLPKASEVTVFSAKELGYSFPEHLIEDIESMHEENPMLGLRGCRLGICRPELTKMQVEAIMHAAADLMEEQVKPFPRIMVPLIGSVAEFQNQAILIKRTAERVRRERGIDIPYEIGTMIEVPRAALISDQIAAVTDPEDGQILCSFFSYGTNDLTQMTLGISRDDAGQFIPTYLNKGIFERDPFKTIDVDGVGWLIQLSATKGRAVNPNLSLSICGEHGGDPESIDFFDSVGLDYVSCSPFRVPIARLAAGQAAAKRQIAGSGGSKNVSDRISGDLINNLN